MITHNKELFADQLIATAIKVPNEKAHPEVLFDVLLILLFV